MTQSPLFFIHIPKAGGTSLRTALTQSLGERLISVYDEPPHTAVTTAAERREVPQDAVLFGHFSWGLHRKMGLPPRYAVVLRHPVERILSWYRWHGTHPHLTLYERVVAGAPIEEFLGSAEANNRMTTMLSGAKRINIAAYWRARSHLRRCAFVSVTECLATDRPLLSGVLDAGLPELPWENRSRFNVEFGPSAIAAIVRRNHWDLALYRDAQRLSAVRREKAGLSR